MLVLAAIGLLICARQNFMDVHQSSPQEVVTSAVHMDNPMSDSGSLGEESEHAGNEDDKADDEDEA